MNQVSLLSERTERKGERVRVLCSVHHLSACAEKKEKVLGVRKEAARRVESTGNYEPPRPGRTALEFASHR